MLEEELGLTLEAYEHPLKQALGAFCGLPSAQRFVCLGFGRFPASAFPRCRRDIAIFAAISAKLERNRIWNSIVWNLAIVGLVAGWIHFYFPLDP